MPIQNNQTQIMGSPSQSPNNPPPLNLSGLTLSPRRRRTNPKPGLRAHPSNYGHRMDIFGNMTSTNPRMDVVGGKRKKSRKRRRKSKRKGKVGRGQTSCMNEIMELYNKEPTIIDKYAEKVRGSSLEGMPSSFRSFKRLFEKKYKDYKTPKGGTRRNRRDWGRSATEMGARAIFFCWPFYLYLI